MKQILNCWFHYIVYCFAPLFFVDFCQIFEKSKQKMPIMLLLLHWKKVTA